MDTSTVLINRHHEYNIFIDLGLYCLCAMKWNKTERLCSVQGSRQLHIFCEETARPIFCGSTTRRVAVYTDVQTLAAILDLLSHTTFRPPSKGAKLPEWVWTFVCILQVCATKVLYLVKLLGCQPHQMAELRVPWGWGERVLITSAYSLFNHLTWLITWQSFIDSSHHESFR
jgi:hypothetical protein